MKNFSKSAEILFNKIENEARQNNELNVFKSDLKKTLEKYFEKVNSIKNSNLNNNLKKELIKDLQDIYIDYFFNLNTPNSNECWTSFNDRKVYKFYVNEIYSYIINVIKTKAKKTIRELNND